MEKDLMTSIHIPVTKQQIIEQAKKEIELIVKRIEVVQNQITTLNTSIHNYGEPNQERVMKRLRSLWYDLKAAVNSLKHQRAALDALRGRM